MPKRRNLINQTFGRLTVLEFAGISKYGYSLWLCRCNCDKEIIIAGRDLKSGNTQSCGCLKTKHGLSRTPEYYTWHHMKTRCTNSKQKYYPRYNSLGIYEPWLKFEVFLQYLKNNNMYPRPEGKSIDRIKNEQGYFPGNIRWSTPEEQANNRRPHKIRSDNTSGFKGVSYNKAKKKWIAQISINNKRIFLGYFPTPELAAQAIEEALQERNTHPFSIRVLLPIPVADPLLVAT